MVEYEPIISSGNVERDREGGRRRRRRENQDKNKQLTCKNVLIGQVVQLI